jgi:pyrimidine-nucleoside phosphorylase
MDQPLGRTAGNWLEVAECVELLRGERPNASEDLRELSLELAGWMIHLGGKAFEPEEGRIMAEAALKDGRALAIFESMVEAQGGDLRVFDDLAATHRPGVTHVLEAWETGTITAMDTTEIGWAVQRTGAGRAKPGAGVDAHAGIEFHARRGARVERGQPVATIYATDAAHVEEPARRLKAAIQISAEPPRVEQALVGWVFDRQSAEAYLAEAGKVVVSDQ